MSSANWTEHLADKIRSEWIEWEAEAEELTANEQDSRAGEQHLHAKLMEAIESAISAERRRSGSRQ